MTKILSVALENHPGALADLMDLLAKEKVNIQAIEAEAMGDFGSVRLLVENPGDAAKALRKRKYDVVEAEALELHLANRPGELARVSRKLAEAGINVVSLFGTTPGDGGDGRLLLRVNNLAAARSVLGLV